MDIINPIAVKKKYQLRNILLIIFTRIPTWLYPEPL